MKQHGATNLRGRLVLGLAVLGALAIAWLASRAIGGLADLDPHGASTETVIVDSKAVGRKLAVSVVVPEGASEGSARPLLVFLHGRGGDEDSLLVEEMYDALGKLGDRAPVVAFPDGEDHSYWHARADGDWDRYVADEVIPEVTERFDVDPDRVAVGGISMGGFGAFDLALNHPGRFCAVGGHSAALWQTSEETAEGAFDDAADFARNDVVASARSDPGALSGQPVWLDSGDEDPFRPGIDALASTLTAAGAPLIEKTWPGGHESGYWNRHWPAYLRFYARALRNCDGK